MVRYAIPQRTTGALEGFVQEVVENPGQLLNPGDFEEAEGLLDPRELIRRLPGDITREDLVGIVRLAMLTESATDAYAGVFYEGARLHKAPWLSRFIERVWAPDEYTHRVPFKRILMELGFTEEQLDRDMREVQALNYEHCCGKTPVELTAYGIIQEYLTDNWYLLMAPLLKPSAPAAAFMVNQVKRRETLHRVWYTRMTAFQVEGRPELLNLVAGVIADFTMPGKKFVPEQERASEWLPQLGADFHRMAKDFVMYFSQVAGTMPRRGQLLGELAARKGYKVGPFSPRALKPLLHLGGYGLLGEAALERVNLPLPQPTTWWGKRRASLRSWLSRRIDLRLVTGT